MSGIAFDNSYARLPAAFFSRVQPTAVNAPHLLKFNEKLAAELGLDLENFSPKQLGQIFSGNLLLPGMEPLAQAYAGHQFGHFVPQLGDGRAILLGEVIDRSGQRRDIQLKGAGRTPFSRGGDGRAALGPVMREYLVGEAMHHLGIPTTRGLAMVSTGEGVRREMPLPGAIFTRVASSHVRVGTFEFFAWRRDNAAVKTLADYVIDRHYPGLESAGNPYERLFESVLKRQANLVAQWLAVGFIHGVMNTDNTTISGETIDYGPCAFLDEFKAAAVFSSIDANGRYAFSNQPRAALWNLSVLASALLPLFADDEDAGAEKAKALLETFNPYFQDQLNARMTKKLGLNVALPGDVELLRDFLVLMENAKADYTLAWRYLSRSPHDDAGGAMLSALFGNSLEFAGWLKRWRERILKEGPSDGGTAARMLAINPAFIARNHRIEEAIAKATEHDDLSAFERLLEAVEKPFDERENLRDLMAGPQPEEKVLQTFCGT